MSTTKEILKQISLFSGLSEHDLDAITNIALKKSFPKNTVLFSEGDETDSLYIICDGKVKVTISDNEGNEVILSILGVGEYFGEMALLDSEPRSASAVSKEPCEILIISKKDFMNIFSVNPVAANLLKGVIRRLRDANKKIESLALLDVYGRVARVLTQMAKPLDEKLIIQEKLTHQEIANMIGSSREMVSIILKELANGGYISVSGKQITINKKLPYSF
ncbi:MAG: Crp/Fnr family transcriptional regulator [Pseudomonadota bacterium]